MCILGVYYLPDEHVPDHIWMATLYHFIAKPVWMELGGGAQAYWAFGHRTRCNYIVSGALKFEYNPLNKLSSTNIQDVNKARELNTRNSCFLGREYFVVVTRNIYFPRIPSRKTSQTPASTMKSKMHSYISIHLHSFIHDSKQDEIDSKNQSYTISG